MRAGRVTELHPVTHVVDKDVLQVDSKGSWHVSLNAEGRGRSRWGVVVKWSSRSGWEYQLAVLAV